MGRGRVLSEQDLEQVMYWCAEFARAVGEDVSIDADTWADTRFADKRYTLWETPDGTPASIACLNPMIGGQIQVDIVYTPPRRRGRGYAGAVTAEVSRAALAEGARDVVLFADLSHPTSGCGRIAVALLVGSVRLISRTHVPTRLSARLIRSEIQHSCGG